MIGTWPDIAFAVTHLSQFSTNPTKDHYKAAQHVCHYLVRTHDYKLVYTQEEDKGLVAFTDSDWAADKIWQRSITGYFFKLANGIILRRSHAQKTVALSSKEAEYMAISDCSWQVIWIKTLIKELRIEIRSIPIYGDNQGSIFIASNAVQESHTKHIDICYHYMYMQVSCCQTGWITIRAWRDESHQYVHQEFAEDKIHTVPKSVRPGIQSQTSLGNLPENACTVDTPSAEHGGVLNA